MAEKPVVLLTLWSFPTAQLFVEVFHSAVDAAGVRHPLAANRFSLSVTGPGRVLGVGNGNPRAMESFTDPSAHSLFFG